MNPYAGFVEGFIQLRQQGRAIPLATAPRPPKAAATGPTALLFSPHPDDECITGGLPLRLARESGWRIVNVAVTLGSNKARQAARLAELTQACAHLGFELTVAHETGLEGINRKTRDGNPAAWRDAVSCVAALLSAYRPAAVVMPHERDANSTHQGTSLLVRDALAGVGPAVPCRVVETEFWAPMASPNLLAEIPAPLVAELIAALSFHVGEVQRNPYHLSLPAWMMDNVRRGGEVVGGQGGAAPEFPYATLYRVQQWDGRVLSPAWETNRILTAQNDPASIAR